MILANLFVISMVLMGSCFCQQCKQVEEMKSELFMEIDRLSTKADCEKFIGVRSCQNMKGSLQKIGVTLFHRINQIMCSNNVELSPCEALQQFQEDLDNLTVSYTLYPSGRVMTLYYQIKKEFAQWIKKQLQESLSLEC